MNIVWHSYNLSIETIHICIVTRKQVVILILTLYHDQHIWVTTVLSVLYGNQYSIQESVVKRGVVGLLRNVSLPKLIHLSPVVANS